MMITKTKEVNFRNDVFFKYALSADDETSKFIRHTIIEELTGIHPKESKVLNPIMDAKIIGKKGVILDVHVKDEQGNEYDIEMQTTYIGSLDNKRFQLYLTRMLSNQLKRGDNYRKLQHVYQIVFIDAYALSNHRLINKYELKDEDGDPMGGDSLIRSIFIHLPAIERIAKEKGALHMSGFEQLCYLFKNSGNRDILKSDERLVKAIMEKYEHMQDDEDLWSIAMAIEMGEMRVENQLEERTQIALEQGMKQGIKKGMKKGLKEGLEKGIEKGMEMGVQQGIEIGSRKGKEEAYLSVVADLIMQKYETNETAWLSTLSHEQALEITKVFISCETLSELKEKIM
ncbi:Rpn family recombination-promoting nuclease/putative transposase [Amedibacillus sp. YH-ame10]